MTTARVAVLAVVVLVVGCGGARTATQSAETVIEPRDLYPLTVGNAWSYDVDTGEPLSTLAVTRVVAFDGTTAEVRTGRASVRYEVRGEGIYVPSDDAWLVRTPLEEGSTWPARGGRTARLVSINASIETSAGSFSRCVEVLESGGKLELEVRTIYCPGVGPVAVDSTMRSKVSERVVSVHARLRGYSLSPLPAPAR